MPQGFSVSGRSCAVHACQLRTAGVFSRPERGAGQNSGRHPSAQNRHHPVQGYAGQSTGHRAGRSRHVLAAWRAGYSESLCPRNDCRGVESGKKSLGQPARAAQPRLGLRISPSGSGLDAQYRQKTPSRYSKASKDRPQTCSSSSGRFRG